MTSAPFMSWFPIHRGSYSARCRELLPSPLWAGESHVDLRSMLHQPAIWILRRTPESNGGSDAEICQDFPRFARSASGERAARIARCPCHLAGCGAVRSEMRDRHGAVWPIEGEVAAAIPAIGARDPQPR